jgi:uncharacterized protein (DUF1800 family)
MDTSPPSSTRSTSSVSPWSPLPASDWNEATARHLLTRAGWSASQEDLNRAIDEGMEKTFNRLFPAGIVPFSRPPKVEAIRTGEIELENRLANATQDEKKIERREFRQRFQSGYQELVSKWLTFAAQPIVSAQEKWVLCLSDVYVVAFGKVRNPWLLYQHQAILRERAFGPAPWLSKAISRSPAMIEYLDLNENKKDAPNENFARELFELFVLGEGHYTEADIKNAARAFTGYRARFGDFVFARGQHDFGAKTVFGHTGNFDGDGVIDLAYQTPAASTFLPGEMLRFYLTDDRIEPAALTALGHAWAAEQFHLHSLLRLVFTSRFFYEPSYRGNYIKSPIQFYLGLLQDLQLDVNPVARQVVNTLRQMGQMPFNPPNVRGWVGGRSWISSSTLGARRQLVQSLFTPLQLEKLNADDVVEIHQAEAEGHRHFALEPADLDAFAPAPASPARAGGAATASARELIRTFLPSSPESEYEKAVAHALHPAKGDAVDPARIRSVLLALLQSPEYQLC